MNRNADQTRDHIRNQILGALHDDSRNFLNDARNASDLRRILQRTFERDLAPFGTQRSGIVAEAIRAASIGVEDDVTPRITEQIRIAAPRGMPVSNVRNDVIEGNRIHLIVLAEAGASPNVDHVSVGENLFRNALNALVNEQAVYIDTDSNGVQYIMAGPPITPPPPPPPPPTPQPDDKRRLSWKAILVGLGTTLFVLAAIVEVLNFVGIEEACDFSIFCQEPEPPSNIRAVAAPPTNTPVRVPTAVPTQRPAQPAAPAPVAVAVAPTHTPTATLRPTSTPRPMPTKTPRPRAANTPTPNPTPTGGRIAFDSDRSGSAEIYVMYADGSGQKRLTHNPAAEDWNPIWSPDGRRIAFLSDRDDNTEIYVMDADGSDQTRLTRNSTWDGVPTWSPDGRRIAFVSEDDGYYDIYVINADGSDRTLLTHNSAIGNNNPSWSPDGQRIAFSLRDSDTNVYVMNTDGSGQTQLTNKSRAYWWLRWSPDGRRIAFTSFEDGPADFPEIYVMNADGSGQKRLTNSSRWDGRPSWSPDGRYIAFESNRDGDSEIYVMNSDGSGVRQLTNNSGHDDGSPSWTR